MSVEAGVANRSAPRLPALDIVRGLIMAVMALDHAGAFIAHRHSSEFWGGEITRYEGALPFLTRFVTHFCAPGFFFLMGCGMALFADSRRSLGWGHGRIAGFFVRRGLLLVLLNQLVENPAWLLGLVFQVAGGTPQPMAPGGGGSPWILTGVLTGLGLSLALGGTLLRLGTGAWLGLAALGLAITNTLTPGPDRAAVLFNPLLRVLLIPGQTGFLLVLYPLVPWFAIAALGVAFGRWLGRDPRAAYRVAPWIGVASLLLALGLRAAGGFGNLRPPRDTSWIEFLNFVKYPPALVFTAFTLGGNLMLLGLLARVRSAAGALDGLAVFGRTPLFFYFAHLYLYALVGALFFRRPVSLEWMYGVWLAGLIPLWFMCRRYRTFKESRPAESVWRML